MKKKTYRTSASITSWYYNFFLNSFNTNENNITNMVNFGGAVIVKAAGNKSGSGTLMFTMHKSLRRHKDKCWKSQLRNSYMVTLALNPLMKPFRPVPLTNRGGSVCRDEQSTTVRPRIASTNIRKVLEFVQKRLMRLLLVKQMPWTGKPLSVEL